MTFTCLNLTKIKQKINIFLDNLQRIHHYLPLRTIPLEIKRFTPTKERFEEKMHNALINQYEVIKYWDEELSRRFNSKERNSKIFEINIKEK